MLLFLGAGIAMSTVPVKFFPDSDRAQVLAYIDLPRLALQCHETEDVLELVFDLLDNKERYPHVDNYAGLWRVGGPRFVLSLTPLHQNRAKRL